VTDQPTTCPAATWAGLTICVTCPTPEPGTACAREPDALLRAATARTTPDNPAASNNETDNTCTCPDGWWDSGEASHLQSCPAHRCDLCRAEPMRCNPAPPVERASEPNEPGTASNDEPACGDTKWHPPHRYMRGGKIGECRGAEAASDDGLRDRYAAAIDEGFRTFDAEQSEDAYLITALVDSVMALRNSEFQQVRATNRRLNLRCQEVESALATIKRAVGEWEISERGTYVPLRTIAAIGKAVGRDIDDGRYELHYQRVDTAEATVTRIITLTERWIAAGPPPIGTPMARWWDKRLAELHAALGGPADTTPPAEDPAVDTCRPVQVDGDTTRVHGSRPLTGLELGYAAEIVAAARRKHAAEPPVVPDDDGTESARTRRIRARQRGEVAAEPERRTACGHDITSRCPNCRVREAEAKRQLDADPHGLEAGMIVKPYTERGQKMWVFRCWGTDTCDGWLSLDHHSAQSAERARDRHVTEEHTDTPEEIQ
jgi:hypothetical protein